MSISITQIVPYQQEFFNIVDIRGNNQRTPTATRTISYPVLKNDDIEKLNNLIVYESRDMV